MATRPRPRSAMVHASPAALLAVLLAASACAGARGRGGPPARDWHVPSVGAVSRPVSGAGVSAVTTLGIDGRLRTLVVGLTEGRPLWTRPATIAGRPAGMGVAPPAVAGTPGRTVVVAVEPAGRRAAIVARDARTGMPRWTRPVDSTLGPAACGDAVCVAESTARKNAAFTVLDAATGRPVWRTPGVAEVEWADRRRVVVLRMAAAPAIEAYDLASGRRLWTFPIERALGHGVDLTGGWSFGTLDDVLIGYFGPYRARPGGRPSAFGFFAVRLTDGERQWARRRLLRVRPGANPAVALIAREVDAHDRPGGFVQLDPRYGGTVTPAPVVATEPAGGWPAFPADLSALGLVAPGRAGRAYDLRTGRPLAGHVTAWSYCAAPSPLKIAGQRGFRPVAALCPYDLRTGGRLSSEKPPPGWYTGAADGWRVWRDEEGGLHGRRDAKGTAPGMYG